MKHLAKLSYLVAALAILAIALCLGCSKPADEPTDEPVSADDSTTTNDQSSDGQSSDGQMVTIVEGTPLIWFVGTDEMEKLRTDMDEGKIPTSCNVLYDQMGSLPDVTVTDPETIKEIYALVQEIFVPEGGRAFSQTDSYHHVIFTLQDGTKVGFSFEGVHNLCLGQKNYYVTGDEDLWAYVRQLQDDFLAGKITTETTERTPTEDGVHAIIIEESEEGLVTSCPTSAREGELVTIRTVGVADAELTLKVDGIRLRSSDGMGTEFQFWMPDRDVVVTVNCRVYPGGA